METTTSIKPKTLAELLPGLSGILSKDSIQTLTAKKQPPSKVFVNGTAEKVYKPLTAAEMRADLLSLKVQSPRITAQGDASTKRKTWNSTVKIDKTVSRTANGQMRNNPVKKALNFHPRPNPIPNSRATMANESTKFLKPDIGAKKKLFTQARSNVRISGISNISETPVVNKQYKSRMTIANKENIPKHSIIKKPPPKIVHQKKYVAPIPDTPKSNESWKSSDSSFLQKEKEINDVEEKAKALSEERTLENIAEVTPPVSTPFREYRNVEDFFDHSHEVDNSGTYHDNTIMYFDNASEYQGNKREESVIVSLCDMLNKATVNSNTEKNTELKDLELIERRTEHNIRMIDNSIAALNKIKESQLTSLQSVRRLIKEKQSNNMETDKKSSAYLNKTLTPQTKDTKIVYDEKESLLHQQEIKASAGISVIQTVTKPPKIAEKNSWTLPIEEVKAEKENLPHHVDIKPLLSNLPVIQITPKSPTYKIPKKNLCLRKKVFYKSMPNISNDKRTTPVKTNMGHQALDMYMKMKEHMHFLSTPISKQGLGVPNTPGMTSHNLQKQLDKLYSEL